MRSDAPSADVHCDDGAGAPAPAPGDPNVSASTPSTRANWLSKVTFWWMTSFLLRGASRPLEESDCHQLHTELDAAQLALRFDVEWAHEQTLAAERKAKAPPTPTPTSASKTSAQPDEAAATLLQKTVDAAEPAHTEEHKIGVRGDAEAPKTAEKAAADAAKPQSELADVPPARTPEEPSLGATLYRLWSSEILLGALLKAINDGLILLQPKLLQMLLNALIDDEFGDPDAYPGTTLTRPDEWKLYVLATAIGVCPLIGGLLENIHQNLMTVVGFKIRTTLVEKMFEKSLRLSPSARAKFSTGKIVNTMSSDTFLIDQFMQYAHLCWSAFAQIVVAIALLIDALGWQAIIGLLVLFFLLPIAGAVMGRWMSFYAIGAPIKDRRVKLINEILQGIRLIKVYVWEDSFLKRLLSVRDEELAIVWQTQKLMIHTTVLWTCTPLFISLVTFITLGLTSDSFTPARVFTAISLFNVLRMPLMMGPAAMAQYASASVALRRIEIYLLAEELQWKPKLRPAGSLQDESGTKLAIKIKNATFVWDSSTKEKEKDGAPPAKEKGAAISAADVNVASPDGKSATDASTSSSASSSDNAVAFQLASVDLGIPERALTVIVGTVGSGKSSILSAMLGEMRRVNGSVSFAGSVAYCAQKAWIQNATLKENVLFGRPLDPARYAEALHYAALEHDVSVLPAGDATEIGEKGITLSGGQQARTGLARAIYGSSDILLLDDPLSAVDAHVGSFMFHTTIREHLRERTCVLVTHQLQYVQHADYIIMMDQGRIAQRGTYAELMAAPGAFAALINDFGGKQDEDEDEEVNAGGETESKPGKQSSLRKRRSSGEKKLVKKTSTAAGADAEKLPDDVAKLMQVEERERGGVAFDVYVYYFKAGGGIFFVLCAVLLCMISAGAESYGGWWVSEWSEDKHHKSRGFYVGIYATISLSQVVFTVIMMLVVTSMSLRASRVLHEQSFQRVLRAPASFFDTTPLGRILNRFSRDQALIDEQLMHMVQNVMTMTASLLGMLIIVAIVIPFILIVFAVVLTLYVVVERAFRNSNRELKRIENIARSPLYAHFAETLNGLSTIRAYTVESVFIRTHRQRLNHANRSTFMLLMTQRWLSVRIETISAVVAFLSAIIVVIQRASIGAGQAGLAISYAISLPMLLNWLVRCTSEAESGMSAAERAKYYAEQLPQEAPHQCPTDDSYARRRPTPWPATGSIRFDDVHLRYRESLPLVLKGVTFEIKPGERVGFVGRTGAGKSSLMVALYRMVELAPSSGGRILIDDEDISKIGLNTARGALAIIPQDSLLFSGTVRSNLDPFKQSTDEQVWEALERTHLADAVRRLPLQLDEPIVEGGENLSQGERALVCLARTWLRRDAKILIMDEATASIDPETDAAVQLSLRQFSQRTLLTIAHRLHTIIDYDRVCVMADGRVAEFDTPARLLRNPHSAFRKMVDDTGAASAAFLTDLANRAESGWQLGARELVAGGAADDGILSGLASPSVVESRGDGVDELHEHSTVRWHEHDEAPEDEHPTSQLHGAGKTVAPTLHLEQSGRESCLAGVAADAPRITPVDEAVDTP